MNDSTKSKLFALQTVALWILVLTVCGWLIFKPDNNVSRDTIDKLTVAVDRISAASEKMTQTANAQREWAENLQKSVAFNADKRDHDYENLYEKYGYNGKTDAGTLSDLYNLKLQRSENIGSGDLRGDEDRTGKAGVVQKPTGDIKK